MNHHISAYQQASRRYIWDITTFQPYLEVISQVVTSLVAELREVEYDGDFEAETYLSRGIGLFRISDEHDVFSGFALYISNDKRFVEDSKSLYNRFKFLYKVHVGATTFLGDMYSFGLTQDSSTSRRRRHLEVLYDPFLKKSKMTSEEIEEVINCRIKLVSKFESLANKFRLTFQLLHRGTHLGSKSSRYDTE